MCTLKALERKKVNRKRKKKKEEGETQTSGRKWDRGMITPPVYSIRDQEGVGHVCVESFPLVKGFRIVEGEKEEEEG